MNVVQLRTFVTVVDLMMNAFAHELHKALGIFIPLIVVNCIILGRAEAFASKNTVWRSVLDGIGMGFGFVITLLLLGAVREVLGSGSLLGVELFGPTFQDWVILVLPSGGFFTFAGWLLFFNWRKQRKARLADLAHCRRLRSKSPCPMGIHCHCRGRPGGLRKAADDGVGCTGNPDRPQTW